MKMPPVLCTHLPTDKPAAARHPRRTLPDRIRKIRRTLEANLGGEHDHVEPQVPREHEAHRLVETELGPLIQASFERHQPIEVDHHRGRRQIEQHEGQQPEDDMRRSELSRHADPCEPDDEEDLREGEIADAKLLFQ
jgi:hypothetical protein